MSATVVAVHRKAGHAFSKDEVPDIELVAGHGVLGDAHFGTTVKHRSRVARDPSKPNLRQVHLLQQELFTEVRRLGHALLPGQMGENITTQGIDLLALGTGTRLRLGSQAIVEITGLRNPCVQIESFQAGLLAAVLERNAAGVRVRKAGVMGVVVVGGTLKAGDTIERVHQPTRFRPLHPV